jgi:hypothetical protein
MIHGLSHFSILSDTKHGDWMTAVSLLFHILHAHQTFNLDGRLLLTRKPRLKGEGGNGLFSGSNCVIVPLVQAQLQVAALELVLSDL